MKIDEARQIPLHVVVEYYGGKYSHTDRYDNQHYYSPFRPDERTPSFKIYPDGIKWHDFGQPGVMRINGKSITGSGGDILDLWCDKNFIDRRSGIKEALQGLEQFNKIARHEDKHAGQPRGKEQARTKTEQPTFKIVKIARRISHIGLLQELQRRRVSLELAEIYLQQGQILNTVNGKTYYGFLFENNKGGYELSIPNPHKNSSFKTCIGNKGISYFPPAKEKNSGDVFEGFFDFLSWLEIKKIKHPMHHSFILNSNSLAGEATEQIIGMSDTLSNIFLFLDNDTSGYETTHAMALELEPHGFQTASMEGFYNGFKDVSSYFAN